MNQSQDSKPSIIEVGISYSSKDSDFVNALDEELKMLGISLIRYERSLEPQKRIDAFASQLASCALTFVVLSEDYFKSPYCLYELLLLSNTQDRAFLVVAGNCSISEIAEESLDKHKKWSEGYRGADWIRARLAEIDWTASADQVAKLLSKRASSTFEILSSEGRKAYLKQLNWLPESFAQKLDSILEIDDLISREMAFDDYLCYAYPNAPYLLTKALSYEKSAQYDLALLYAERALEEDPTFSSVYVFACRVASQATDNRTYDKALEIVSKFSSLSSRVVPSDRPVVYKAQGLLAFNKSKLECGESRKKYLLSAKEFLERSLEIERDSSTLNALAQVQEHLGNANEALDLYSQSVDLDPQNYAAFNNLALITLRLLDEPDLAIQLFKQSLAINPHYSLALNGLAIASEMADPLESLYCYLCMATDQYKESDAITNAATLLEELQEFKAADALYRLALAKNNQGVATNFNYAAFQRRNGNNRELVKRHLRISLDAGCDAYLIELHLALLDIRDGFISEAIDRLKRLMNTRAATPAEFFLVYCAVVYDASISDFVDLTTASTYWPLNAIKARLAYDSGYFSYAEELYEFAKTQSEGIISEQDSVSLVVPDALFSVVDYDLLRLLGDRIDRKYISNIDLDSAEAIRTHIERLLSAN